MSAYIKCPTCHGRGTVVRNEYNLTGATSKEKQCPNCKGTGQVKKP